LVCNLNQTPGNYPKEDNLSTLNHGESLKFNKLTSVCHRSASNQTDNVTEPQCSDCSGQKVFATVNPPKNTAGQTLLQLTVLCCVPAEVTLREIEDYSQKQLWKCP
jgi:hypothetical protein